MDQPGEGLRWALDEDDLDDKPMRTWDWRLRPEERAWCLAKAKTQLELNPGGSRMHTPERRLKRYIMYWEGLLVASRCLDIPIYPTGKKKELGVLEYNISVRTSDNTKPVLWLGTRDVTDRAYILVRVQQGHGLCMGWVRFDAAARARGQHAFRPGNTGTPDEVWGFHAMDLRLMEEMAIRIEALKAEKRWPQGSISP